MKQFEFRGMVLLAALATFAACQTAAPPTGAAEKPCPAGRADARAPVVCVDDSDLRDLRVHPEPVEVAHGSTVQWFTRTNRGNLTIVFDDPGAFDVTCREGSGYCTASPKAGASAASYKYSVKIAADGETYVLDPTVTIVDAR